MKNPLNSIQESFRRGFEKAGKDSDAEERRIGAELKFPLVVDPDGTASAREQLTEIWTLLQKKGWEPDIDTLTGSISGACKPGERNNTVASFETGYCKPEFSLAHVGSLSDLDGSIESLREELEECADSTDSCLIGYGIQPVTPPSADLMMKKERSSVWDKAVPSNTIIPETEGDDVALFTVNAASHVHISVSEQEAVKAVNVLNGFAGAQIALMADSSVWKGDADSGYMCAAEKFWDWWEPSKQRSGIPLTPFCDIEDYIQRIMGLAPIYIKRDGKPLIPQGYASFLDYYSEERARTVDLEGKPVQTAPEPADVDLHNSCYWYTARISRYYTVENRACDQQPPEDLIAPAALTLGLVSVLDEAWEELNRYDWSTLRDLREAACRNGLKGSADGLEAAALSALMLELAETGLSRRNQNEERFLAPLKERSECPAREAEDLFRNGGAEGLVNSRRI